MLHGKLVLLLVIAALFSALALGGPASAAVGCDLNDPDNDVRRLFPEATSYETVSLSIQDLGGDKLLAQVETKLRDQLRGLYEKIDQPYSVYVVYQGERKIGYIHGVDQKGRYGAMQLFLSLDLDQRIRELYVQRMRGNHARIMRSAEFAAQFAGLTLNDFYSYDVATGKASGKVAAITNPVPKAEHDFRRLLRGTKKNLVLINEFIPLSPELSAPTRSARR